MDDGIPRPLSHIGCQDILEMRPTHNGWLKYHVTSRDKSESKFGGIGDFVRKAVDKVISPWRQMYVVIHRGNVYVFSGDMATKPRTAFSLYMYNRVGNAANEFQQKKEYSWAFRLEHVNHSYGPKYFAASSKSEMKSWMSHLNREMREANNMPGRPASVASGDSGDTEDPIYDLRESLHLQSMTPIEFYNSDSDSSDYDTVPETDAGNYVPGRIANKSIIGQRKQEPLPPTPLPNIPKMPPELNEVNDMPTTIAPTPPGSQRHRPLPGLPLQGTANRKPNLPPLTAPKPRVPLKPPGAVPVMMGLNNLQLHTEKDDVTMATWDGGPKGEVKRVLLQIAKDGAFVIRNSSNETNPYQKVLAVYYDGETKQYKINTNSDGKVFLNAEDKFDSLLELLQNYKRSYLPNTSIFLDKPYSKYSYTCT